MVGDRRVTDVPSVGYMRGTRLQLAESHLTQRLFGQILGRIEPCVLSVCTGVASYRGRTSPSRGGESPMTGTKCTKCGKTFNSEREKQAHAKECK